MTRRSGWVERLRRSTEDRSAAVFDFFLFSLLLLLPLFVLVGPPSLSHRFRDFVIR